MNYEVIFDDLLRLIIPGESKLCTFTKKDRKSKFPKPSWKSLDEIKASLIYQVKTKETNHSVELLTDINYPTQNLIIDPHLLGLWLGDGNSHYGSITTADLEILKDYNPIVQPSSITLDNKSRNYFIPNLYKHLKALNLLKNKHIPNVYIYSNKEQRLFLLQGLMDSDGFCSLTGECEFCTTIPGLAKQVLFLTRSLGIKSKIHKNKSFLNKVQHKDRFRINFITQYPVFRLSRKLDRLPLNKSQVTRNIHRFIKSITETQDLELILSPFVNIKP